MKATTKVGSLVAAGLAATMLSTIAYLPYASVARGQSRQNPVRADLIELFDSRGTPRARLGLSGGNQEFTYLHLMDSSGHQRITINVHPDDQPPEIAILNNRGQRVADLVQGARSPGLGGPPIRKVAAPRGKADSATPEDIRRLQTQIDTITFSLNQAIDRINAVR